MPRPDGLVLDPPKAKVSIGPEGSKYEYPTCTCSDFIEAQRACRHIFYVLDNVLNYKDEELEDDEGTLSLRYDGHCLRSHTAPYHQLKSTGLAYAAQSHGWTFSGPGEWAIADQARDMIRHFDSATDYPSSHYSDEYLSVSSSLAGAVYRLAIAKPEFFADLRQEAPVESCTKSYFRDLDRQVDYTFRRWINYTKTGCPRLDYRDNDTHPDNLTAPNVVWISNTLRKFVYNIETTLYERQEMTYENRCRAFELLLKMLETVIQMDLDAQELDYRPRAEMVGGTGAERNLFTRLIGNYSPDYPNFAIKVMRTIPEAGRQYIERLFNCRWAIQEKASKEFASEFDKLCREVQN
ncbi:hypothetical protein TWF730_005604 [Orbilia blumenaviensis]|uniref:SWIM-type domain-containing protein n=1 Tax=Orbilia blumenaviensis TaxID=1796055 RepID=A0AAV9VQ12_9PEZI